MISNKAEIEFLIKLRDGSQMIADATHEYLETFAPKDAPQSVSEETFSTLRFEHQEGERLGAYELATEKNNPSDKWDPAYKILKNVNATIQRRYFGEGYAYSYWLYGEGRIYRQKLQG
jgi:hypothetical protein